jgi:hypothetical protein
MFLEFKAAASGQPKIDQNFEVDLDEGTAEGQHGTSTVHGLHGELKLKKKSKNYFLFIFVRSVCYLYVTLANIKNIIAK